MRTDTPSIEADLAADDEFKRPVFTFLQWAVAPLYDGGGITPRDLGFDAGSALSTASFKDFAWGISSLYWKQFFDKERRYALADADGDAALMRWICAIGAGYRVRDSDLFGVATSWGAPVEQEADPQMTEQFQVTPAVQMTRNPSFNDEVKNLWVGSVLRMRVAF